MRHILIVDDALDLGRLLKTALSIIDSTMPIVVVPSGEEALLEGTRYPLDLLITDIRLPGISGVELVRKIRKHHPDVRIIVITGMSDEEVRKEVKALKVDYFFIKPLSIPEFTEAARNCLHLSVETTAPESAPATRPGEEDTNQEMADVISGLKNRLDASGVMLVNERARIEAEAGSIPEILRAGELSRLLAVTDASRNLKAISKRESTDISLVVRGAEFDLVFSPIEQYILVVVVKAGASNLRLALCLEEAKFAQKELLRIFTRMGLLVSVNEKPGVQPGSSVAEKSSEAEEEPDVPVEDLEEFKAIFELTPANVDEFWDKASEKSGGVESVDPEALSYDEAHQLGLTPETGSNDE